LEKLKEELKEKRRFGSFIENAIKNGWEIYKAKSIYDLAISTTFSDGTTLTLQSEPVSYPSEITLDLYGKRFLATFRPREIDSIPIKGSFYTIIKSLEDIVKQPKKIHDLAIEKFGIDRAKSKLRKVV